jgi:DDE superfamily endonuclease
MVLVEDETDLLLFPPLRAMWSPRGEPTRVMLSGWNARRAIFGCMNLVTGHRLFQVRKYQRADDFQAFLRHVHRHYRGWHVTLLLDSNRSHTAYASQDLADRLGIRLLWLPNRAPELNPMDTLWGQAKDAVCVNTQYADIDEQADAFIAHVAGLSNREALWTSGVLSKHFWLKRTLSRKFCGPA